MSVTIQYDDFNGTLAAALGSPWTVASGSRFTYGATYVYGDVVPYPTSATLPATPITSRAVLDTFDPYSSLTVTSGVRVMTAQIQIIAPAVLSSTTTTQAGLIIFGATGAALPQFEVLWNRTSGGTSTAILFVRTSSGQSQVGLPIGSCGTVGAGESHTLRVDLTFNGTVQCGLTVYWDGTIIGSTLISSAAMSVYGFSGNVLTNSHFFGLFSSTPGPDHQTGPNASPTWVLDYPIGFDNFTVSDIGTATIAPPLFVAPTLAVDPTLTSISVASENDSTGDTFAISPSYAIQIEDAHEENEHRFDAGYVQTVRKGAVRRRWRLQWDALSSSQRTTFQTHIATVGGTKKAFTWSDPETGGGILVRFSSDPSIDQVAPSVWTAAAELEEVFA